jgi:hypothetical protein
MPTRQTTINGYASAGYPAVAIATADEDRAIASIAGRLKRPTWIISARAGLVELTPQGTRKTLNATDQYGAAFTMLAGRNKPSDHPGLLIVLDFQHVIKTPGMYRALRDTMQAIKPLGSMIALVAPSWKLPAELEHDIPVMLDSLPSREELNTALNV